METVNYYTIQVHARKDGYVNLTSVLLVYPQSVYRGN